MDEERVVKLLEEIRDLQKGHIENYRDALKNQQDAIALQKRAYRRGTLTTIVLVVVLIGFLIFEVYLSKG